MVRRVPRPGRAVTARCASSRNSCQLPAHRGADPVTRSGTRARTLREAPRRPALGDAHEGQGRDRSRRVRDGRREADRDCPCLRKENAEDTTARDRDRPQTGKGGSMKRKFIPVAESFAKWKKHPAYAAAYNSLEAEFALASSLIKARTEADMTQEQVAQAMGTTQAVVARLESGKVLPSTRTLERFAKATRSRLRITFEQHRKTATR